MNSQVFVTDIEDATLKNKAYRRVIYTANYQQLVLMSLEPFEEIGMEVHSKVDQFIRIEQGIGLAVILDKNSNDYKYYNLNDGMSITIPSGTFHNIINLSSRLPLKLYTIYSPPQHSPNTIEMHKKRENHYDVCEF
jgi:mannose-6-phosphate isomerase-like protein (cupin superfamily)